MKTGGRFIRRNVLFPMKNQLNESGIELMVFDDDSHKGWHSRIDDRTYIIHSVRDPVEHSVSYFAHIVCLDNHGNMKEEYNSNSLTVVDLIYELNHNKAFPNFQAKSYLHNENNRMEFYGNRVPFDYDLFNERKNRVNLFLDVKDIAGKELQIQKKIFTDLGMFYSEPKTRPAKSFLNFESKDLFNKLSDKEKDMIRKYNRIDNDLYQNTNFWRIDP
jgi:hypothetical protein